MTFAMEHGARRHDASYRALAEQLAVRVALAVDGASLYQRTRRAVGARDEVLAVVSHDLRNPLSAIKMCVGALRDESPLDAETSQELLGTVHESATLMTRIIQDLLDVASIDAGQLSIDRRLQSLPPILAKAVAMFDSVAIEHQITLTAETDPSLPELRVDADRIIQVLANLLHNACKFTPAGGFIRVATDERDGVVQILVSDTGPGIARDHLPRVFDRFWHDRGSSTIRSTGLGLAIARGIVEAHGGRIWVDSTPGEGSTFTFTLPIVDEVPARVA
jgi:signal transduction histidine kinase